MSEAKYKLSQEVAENILDGLFDYYDIEEDDITDKDQKTAMKVARSKIIRAIRKGNLEIDGCKITQTLCTPLGDTSTIDYGELSGKAKLAMGKVQNDDNYARMYALLGSLSSLGSKAISSLKGKDLALAECLGLVFLVV